MIFQQCFTFEDGILQFENSPVQVIPCSVSSVTDKNNYQPTPQTGEEAERIINKLNSYCLPYGFQFKKSDELLYVPVQTTGEE